VVFACKRCLEFVYFERIPSHTYSHFGSLDQSFLKNSDLAASVDISICSRLDWIWLKNTIDILRAKLDRSILGPLKIQKMSASHVVLGGSAGSEAVACVWSCLALFRRQSSLCVDRSSSLYEVFASLLQDSRPIRPDPTGSTWASYPLNKLCQSSYRTKI
jgi:hypothetical protein